jgi:NitT/TauT family transport system permease protein
LRVVAFQLVLLLVVVAVWQVGSQIDVAPLGEWLYANTGLQVLGVGEPRMLVDPFFFSNPNRILRRDWQWLRDGTIARHVGVTLYEAVMSFVIGVLLGVVIGFLLGRSRFWARVLNPYIQVLNAMPRLIFAPILLLLFGLGENSKIALGVSLVFFIVFFNAFQGVRDVDRNVLNNALMLGANERQLTRHVLLPSAMSWILASLHTSVGFAVAGVVVGEYIGASRGIGYVISQAEGNIDATGVWAGMAVLVVLVGVVEVAVTQAERRLVRWKPQPAGDAAGAQA